MLLTNKKIIFGLTSSQYAFEKTIPQISRLTKEGAEVIPIMSIDAYSTNTKFGKAKEFVKKIETIVLKEVIYKNEDIENLNIFNETDIMIISPCSGNTIGKLANGIMDTPVLKAARKILRSDKSLILGIATVDGLARKCRKYRKTIKYKKYIFCTF